MTSAHSTVMVSRMTDMTHKKPLTTHVLTVLASVSPAGMTASDIARRFTDMDHKAAISSVNTALSRGREAGLVTRGMKVAAVSVQGRKSKAYMWYVTPAGFDCTHPEPPPVITAWDEPPSVGRVMEVLAEAGAQGMRGPDIARHFTIPDPGFNRERGGGKSITLEMANLQRRMSWTNQILDRMARHGFVMRGRKEPSPWYHSVPAYRWFILPEGVQYIADGLAAGRRKTRHAELMRERLEKAAAHRQAANLITQAYLDHDPATSTQCEREAAIFHLRAAGCTLDAIGGVFDITRERVRQILIGHNADRRRPCQCPKHTPEPVVWESDSWWGERMTGVAL